MEEITRAQWEAFRVILKMGLYDMTEPQAVRDSGLEIEIYARIQANYTELYNKFEEADDE